MADKEKRYDGEDVVVRYNIKRCIHFAACVRGLPSVFDEQRRPWIQPGNADADAVAEVVQRCPTGALHFERLDGGAAEQPQTHGSVQVSADGPLYVRGELTLQREDGTLIVKDTRIALCRCGMSGNKPFCDNSHRQGFHDAGALAPKDKTSDAEDEPLTITVSDIGPNRFAGSFTIRNADGSESRTYSRASLCRCGASQHKPFCDGSHNHVNPEIFK
jgi:CDGSH-type Zn-finger protein/uncharacterized Fe-S cluster protein YjdI